MKFSSLCLSAAALAVAGFGSVSPSMAEMAKPKVATEQLKADVGYLANDLLEGREAGTRGFDLAALYVSQRMKAMGLKPGGADGTYLQPVKLVSYGLRPAGTHSMSLGGAAADLPMELGTHYVPLPSPIATKAAIEGDLVFVGYGFVSKTHGRDDFADVDVEGKIVVYLGGAPAFLGSEESAHFNGQTAIEASKRGAIGTIAISNPASRFPFARYAQYLLAGGSRTTWVGEDGAAFTRASNIQASAMISTETAVALFGKLGKSWDEIKEQAATPEGKVDAFDMGVSAKIATESAHVPYSSNNVAGIIEGTDKKLKDEYIVVSAHLDHIGKRPTQSPDQDGINNGAMDNSTGISSMLEAARLVAANPTKRSVMILAVTAEEKGLVGADYFAHHPTVPKANLAANINLDMPVMTYDFQDIIAFGAERSTLFPVVKKAAERAGLSLSPDPMPEQGLFTRSDHYRFVQQGVPSAFLWPGFANGGADATMFFLNNHYHRPSDEIGLINFDYLKRFASLKYEIIQGVGNMKTRPKWYKGDFFGETFDGLISDQERVASLETASTAGVIDMEAISPEALSHFSHLCSDWMVPCEGDVHLTQE